MVAVAGDFDERGGGGGISSADPLITVFPEPLKTRRPDTKKEGRRIIFRCFKLKNKSFLPFKKKEGGNRT